METGTVKFFNNSPDKLFGKIVTSSGTEVFFHFNNGPEGNTRMPLKGERLMFDAEQSPRGPKAAVWAFEGQELTVTPPSWSGQVPELNETLRENLKRFGLEDIVVTGTIDVRRLDHDYRSEKTVVQLGPMHLSQLCGNIWSTLQKRRSDEANLHIEVYHDGQRIGTIDSDHRFHYHAAPDLRTALGWIFATDLGHTKVLGVGLDSAVKGIETVIRKAPVDGDDKALSNFYLGAFKTQLSQTIVYKRTSRFADGHMGTLRLLWSVGTKSVHGRVLSNGNVLVLY